MTRRLVALLACGLLLAACGSQSPQQALRGWVTQSAFAKAVTTLRTDAVHAANALRDAATQPNALHTVCGVLDYDALSANSSLPTPDDQTTSLLSRAYNDLGDGAQVCYGAADSAARRARAIADLERGVAAMAEARARVAAAS